MIPAARWRTVALAVVVLADLVVLGVVTTLMLGLLAVAALLLAAVTTWGLLRPGGWGALALVLTQVAVVATAGHSPETAADWALAAVAAIAVCATHLTLSLLGAWPVRAALPTPTALRWLSHAAFLAWSAILAAGLGALASRTPLDAGPWVLAVGLILLAGVTGQLHLSSRRT
ncbi:MAG: hypothetical protein ABIU87_07290 [Ornithinibacter sp.]